MSQISQKDCVVNAVKNVLGSRYSTNVAVKTILRPDDIVRIRQQVFNEIQGGGVAYSKDATDGAALKRYVASLVSDHCGRAKELNGGVAKAKNTNPTPRATKSKGKTPKSNDSVLLSLNKLAALYDDGTPERAQVNARIAQRTAELTAKTATPTEPLQGQNELSPELQKIIAGL